MNNRTAAVILISLFLIGVIYVCGLQTGLSFTIQSAIRITAFLLVPVLSLALMKMPIPIPWRFRRLRQVEFLPGLAIGIGSFLIVLVAYAIFNPLIDMAFIRSQLQTLAGVNTGNYTYVALFIVVFNSLLEEFLFRGFVFLQLAKTGNRIFAYVYSSLLFASYHLLIIGGWFNPILMGLALLALFTIGMVFDYLNEKPGHILNSWIAHVFADAAIILIGFRLFGFF